MPAIALSLVLIWAAAAVGFRVFLQLRRSGDSGFRVRKSTNRSEGVATALFAIAVAATVLGPLAQMAGLIGALVPSHLGWLPWAGVAVATAGILGTVLAQVAMGDSWRIGVDAGERTALVTNGVFAVVRNPIFIAMMITSMGLALTTPNPVSVSAFLSLVAAVQLQVRGVEEPYLLRTHGAAYVAYAARVGRFLPAVGRNVPRVTPQRLT